MGVPEVKKDHEWCPHVKLGYGCSIYRQRPERCRDFHCMWLIDERIPDYWYPKTSKIVINTTTEDGVEYVAFVVDPSYPTRWREEPYLSDIKAMAKAGIEGKIGKKWTTIVVIKDEKIPVVATPRLLRAAG